MPAEAQSDMSDTPRTDAHEREFPLTWFDEHGRYHQHAHEWREHARKLERENAKLREALKEIIADASCSAYIAQTAEEALK